VSTAPEPDPLTLAARLEEAWQLRVAIEPLSACAGLRTVEQAYATQQAWTELRIEHGDHIVGRKIGLTSAGMQLQMGVNQPDFGSLWGSRWYHAGDGGPAQAPLDAFIQPRVEGEIAFLMATDLAGPDVDAADVLDAVAAAAPAIEIIDSRIAEWRITLADTIADNASYGGFVIGEWSESLARADLPDTVLELSQGGRLLVAERGTAVLGSPLTAVAWLANQLGSFGVTIRRGDIVLSGAFGASAPATPGEFRVAVGGCEPLRMRFA
jgi:2-keto-4-pentenoate hydratase